MSKRVLIVHPDGREYSIPAVAFADKRMSPDGKSYADQGFRIVSDEDGAPYEGPKSKRETEQIAADRSRATEGPKAAASKSKSV